MKKFLLGTLLVISCPLFHLTLKVILPEPPILSQLLAIAIGTFGFVLQLWALFEFKKGIDKLSSQFEAALTASNHPASSNQSR